MSELCKQIAAISFTDGQSGLCDHCGGCIFSKENTYNQTFQYPEQCTLAEGKRVSARVSAPQYDLQRPRFTEE
jgi:hypothetical protein